MCGTDQHPLFLATDRQKQSQRSEAGDGSAFDESVAVFASASWFVAV